MDQEAATTCHFERSEAKWRNLLFSRVHKPRHFDRSEAKWRNLLLYTRRIPLVICLCLLLTLTSCDAPHGSRIVVGCKNFTEQVLLGELLAQQIEAHGEKVDRRFYLAGSYIAHQALLSGRIDAYVEYTGTALSSILKQPVDHDPARVRSTITRLYAPLGVTVEPSLGFQNTFAMVMREQDAAGIQTLTQLAPLAPKLRLGVGYEFEDRPDGLHGMDAAYHLHFAGEPRIMDLGLLYRSIASNQVDIVAGNSTDGAIPTLHLKVLGDDLHYFPPYEAVPLVRDDTLRQHPAVAQAIQQLAGHISEADMQQMNHAVEGDHRDPADVIRDFRKSHDL